jgi:nucleotide-binding universal stress UspA family protein
MSEIIVGYDGSGTSKAALDKASELAKGLGDSVVLVFGYAPGGYGGGEVPAQREAVKEFAEKMVAEGVEQAKGQGVDAEVELVNEDSYEALMNIAEARKARMIVVGSHGEGAIKGAILGSTTHKLVQLSKVPVLVVRP